MISIIYGSSTILNVWQITINFYLIIEHKQGGGFTQQDWVLRSLLIHETETGISHVSYAMDLLSFYAPPHTLSHWMSADQGQQPMTLDSGIKWVINWNDNLLSALTHQTTSVSKIHADAISMFTLSNFI